jgi:hypothetical protein
MSRKKLDGGLRDVRDYPLSDGDIRQILGDNIKIIPYPELADVENINECFDNEGRCIILFLTSSPTAGHWCAMLRKKRGIEFFDPYGEAPEKQKAGLSRSRLEELDEAQPYLTRLMKESGLPIFYNKYAFQQSKEGVATCGRWCVSRCLYGSKSLEYFKKAIDQSGLAGDDFVSALTFDKLRK